MKIRDILKEKRTVSFEFFPPKTEAGEEELLKHIKLLEPLKPDFVSVTYGAGGGTREKTKRVIETISKNENWNVLAHLTCVAHTKAEIVGVLNSYKEMGIENIMALRGDIPQGMDLSHDRGEMPHTIDLLDVIKENFGDYFSIGGAAFPELHPESPNLKWEMRYFKMKAEAGVDFGVTQVFFENQHYYKFIEEKERMGLKIPVIPGIMPITNYKQIRKIADISGAIIPHELVSELEKYEDDLEMTAKIGIEYAIHQCEELLANGAPGIHFYTMNKSMATIKIYEAIKNKF